MKKILVVPLIAALVLTLFAWPASRVGPRELPVGVVGPTAPRIEGVEFRRYASAAQARAAIEDREIYGALTSDKVLVATAASPVAAQALTHGATKPVEDVVAAPREANGLAASVLPLVLAGILTGVLAAKARRRVAALFAGAVLAGTAGALVIDSWLGVVEGDFAANAAALSLTVLAIGSLVAGLYALAGHKGAALGALTMVFVGNPLSGVATGPDMIPGGALGQLLPPGAGGSLLRSTGFFDGAAAGEHIAVLAAYVVIGLALLASRQVMNLLKPVDRRVDPLHARL
ncbi:ABC transporter permease [Solirubrobacter sp. CPCC 204708]|uniref:ABC transporter permease n=1 Tax=Solirubrobacter deserti TaxID=2282478 RepID=A0ABT4RLA9_9ACTN|nr:hypothetical protein [Solirubrobacter deserti]MBE2318936.1 ABC transporter permease [Solirubrobacter deserti]MDA0139339.1 hypothetical protein [Solirubrobacter deserti]